MLSAVVVITTLGVKYTCKYHIMPRVKQVEQYLTINLLNLDIPCFANSVDPDQLASKEAN